MSRAIDWQDIILGPCACKACGLRVWLARIGWVDDAGRKHACQP